MRAEVYICDVCGVQKQDSNHWMILVNAEPGFLIYPWKTLGQYRDADTVGTIGHVCGAGCASKKLNEWLTKQL